MIKPTIGRVIIVKRATPFTPEDGIPALVCRVWSDRCINAAGFNEGGTPVSFSSLTLLQDDDTPPPSGPYAEWMPYQKGQAAKTEALEAAAAPADFRDRVRAEKVDLDDKLQKLDAFRATTTFENLPVDEQGRLAAQANHMRGYSNVLGQRIAAFPV